MASAAPFVASPFRRLVAGVVDFFVLLLLIVIGAALLGQARPSTHFAAMLFIYGLYHAAFFSYLGGATPGLRAFDMRVVSASGGELSLGQTLLRSAFRPTLLFAWGWFAVEIAKPTGQLAAMVVAPVLFEAGLMFTLPTRQTLTDLVARTLVIDVPPPQPHRAPAGPMYSATDAEFGVRSRTHRRARSNAV